MQTSSTVLASSSPSKAYRPRLSRSKTFNDCPPSSPPLLPVQRTLKRGASALLPSIEFDQDSSPPRFHKRQALISPSEQENAIQRLQAAFYPTPLNSEANVPSSPPIAKARKGLTRTGSTLSELRAPLTSVPSIELPFSGDEIRFGRSSNACHYQLSASRLISRVHVKASFLNYGNSRPQIEVQCVGWNGVKVHCQGHVWSLDKGDKFTSETIGAEVMLDAHDARVTLNWPAELKKDKYESTRPSQRSTFHLSLCNDENENPVVKSPAVDMVKKSKFVAHLTDMESGTIRDSKRPTPSVRSSPDFNGPDSPTPLPREDSFLIHDSTNNYGTVQVYEDVEEEEEELPMDKTFVLEEPESDGDVSDSDELELDAENSDVFKTHSRINPGSPLTSDQVNTQTNTPPIEQTSFKNQLSPRSKETITGHLTDQLAFSRVSCLPLSALHDSLPSTVSKKLTSEMVQDLLKTIECIGEVQREGKDAAGKPLQCEYYYKPDVDQDLGRKQAVTELGKTGVRACRRVHKQYYWKRPKNLP